MALFVHLILRAVGGEYDKTESSGLYVTRGHCGSTLHRKRKNKYDISCSSVPFSLSAFCGSFPFLCWNF
jgi:hypothetical protein